MSLYLTQIRLSRSGQRLPLDAQAMHRTIAYAVNGPHLWATPTKDQVIVQAGHPLRADALGPISTETHSGQRPTRYKQGQRVRCALIANPTHAETRAHGERGKVRALPPDRWEEWWMRKTSNALATHMVTATHHRIQRGQKHDSRTLHVLVAYEADCIVRDTEALEMLIRDGIGRGKAYGAGLLLVGETA